MTAYHDRLTAGHYKPKHDTPKRPKKTDAKQPQPAAEQHDETPTTS